MKLHGNWLFKRISRARTPGRTLATITILHPIMPFPFHAGSSEKECNDGRLRNNCNESKVLHGVIHNYKVTVKFPVAIMRGVSRGN